MKKNIFLFLASVYFATRIFNLTAIPIFNDESIYIRYGLHERLEEVSQHYSLIIGKEPLMPNLYAQAGLIFNNYLLGGRLITVLFGFFTLWGVYVFCKKYFSSRIAVVSSILYILNPFTLFFDRLALMDSPINTVAIWSLYFTVEIIRKNNLKKAVGLGVIVGTGFWIKSTSYFYLFLQFIALGFYILRQKKIDNQKIKLFFISAGIALGIFSLLYFDPLFKYLVEQRKVYSYGIFSVFNFPLGVWWNNIQSAFSYLFFFQTPFVFILGIIGTILLLKKNRASDYIFILWFAVPMLYMIFYGRMPTSRYFLVFSNFFIISASVCLDRIIYYKKQFGIIILSLIFIVCNFYNYFLYFSPINFQNFFLGNSKIDVSQYFHGFSSGYGVIEAIDYLKTQAADKKIIVLTRNDSGNPEDAIVVYLYYNNPNIQVIPINEPDLKDFDKLKTNLPKDIPIYFVSRGAYYVGLEKYFLSEKKFTKPYDKEFVGVQRLSVN